MSYYCRFGADSDVYFYMMQGPHIDKNRPAVYKCQNCSLDGKGHITVVGAERAISHLRNHIDAGHRVPTHAIARLEADRDYEKRVDSSP